MTDELFKLLGERPENRVAVLACIIMERGKDCDDNSGLRFPAFQAARIAAELVRLARLIKANAETLCNEENPVAERNMARQEAKFARICALIGMDSSTGGDPRGPCARLIDPNDPTAGDGWGDGWAVYA